MDSTPEQPILPETIDSPQQNEPTSGVSDPLAQPPAPQSSLARRVFNGPFGLRAGWSLLIYLSIFAAIGGGLYLLSHHRDDRQHETAKSAQGATARPQQKDQMTVKSTAIAESIFFVVLMLTSWLMAAIERRSIWVFGLGGAHSAGRFLVGAVWGLAALSLLVGTLRTLHLLVFDAELDHGWAIVGWGSAQLFGFLCVGLVAEYLFRGYLQFTLTRGLVFLGNLIAPRHARTIAFWIAAVITSTLFFVAHTGNSGETPVGLLLVFLAGVVFLVALWRTGSLWWAIGFHMAWDWAQSFLYGVPDSGGLVQGRLFATHALGNPLLSGGTDGPEGSVLCIPILLLVILVLVFFTRPSSQPPLETREQLPNLATVESVAA